MQLTPVIAGDEEIRRIAQEIRREEP